MTSRFIKPNVYTEVRLLIDIPADFSDYQIPKGTLGTIVECYDDPEEYAIDLAIPDSSLVGGYTYENIILTPDQFEIVKS